VFFFVNRHFQTFSTIILFPDIQLALSHPILSFPESGKVYLIMEFCGGGRIFDMDGDKVSLWHPQE